MEKKVIETFTKTSSPVGKPKQKHSTGEHVIGVMLSFTHTI